MLCTKGGFALLAGGGLGVGRTWSLAGWRTGDKTGKASAACARAIRVSGWDAMRGETLRKAQCASFRGVRERAAIRIALPIVYAVFDCAYVTSFAFT